MNRRNFLLGALAPARLLAQNKKGLAPLDGGRIGNLPAMKITGI
jgi:hypothetical protein